MANTYNSPNLFAGAPAGTSVTGDIVYLTDTGDEGTDTASTVSPGFMGLLHQMRYRCSPVSVEGGSIMGELANADFRQTTEGGIRLPNQGLHLYDVPVYIIPGPLSDYPELVKPTMTGRVIDISSDADTLIKMKILEPVWNDAGMRVPGEVFLFDKQLLSVASPEYREDRKVRSISRLDRIRLRQLWSDRLSDIFTAGPFFSGSTMGAFQVAVQGNTLPEGIEKFYTGLHTLNSGVVNPGRAPHYNDWLISLSDSRDISPENVAELPVYYRVHPWVETLILSSMPENTSIANPYNRLTAYVLPSPELIPDFNTYRHLGTVFPECMLAGSAKSLSATHPVSVYRQEGTWRIVILDRYPILAPTLYLAGLPDKRCSCITHIEMPCLVQYSDTRPCVMTIDYRLPPTPHIVSKGREDALRLDLRTEDGTPFSTARKWEFPSVSGVYSGRCSAAMEDPGAFKIPPYSQLSSPDGHPSLPENNEGTVRLSAFFSGLGHDMFPRDPENLRPSRNARPKVLNAVRSLRYGEDLWHHEVAPEMLFANPPAMCAVLNGTGLPVYGEHPEDVRPDDGRHYTYLMDVLVKCPDIGKLILLRPYGENSIPDRYDLSTLINATLDNLKKRTGRVVDLEVLTNRPLIDVVLRRARKKQDWIAASLLNYGVKPEGMDPEELKAALLRMLHRGSPITGLHLKMALRTRPEWFTTMLTILSCGEILMPLNTGSLKKLDVLYF